MGGSQSKNNHARIKRRSLPQTPPASVSDHLVNLGQDYTHITLPHRSASVIRSENQNDYTDLTDSLDELSVQMPFRTWREEINNAGVEDLRTILTNLVSAVESGLQPANGRGLSSKRQATYSQQPGISVTDTSSTSTLWSCQATIDGRSTVTSTLSGFSDTKPAVNSGNQSTSPYNMTVQNVYNISNHGTMYFPGAAQGMQCGDYNGMYMSLQPTAENETDDEYDDNSFTFNVYENLTNIAEV